MKTCRGCGLAKESREFTRNGKRGRYARCRACKNAAALKAKRDGKVKPVPADRVRGYATAMQKRTHALREAILEAAGNRCGHCGFTDWRALQIDHVKSVGKRHKDRAYGVAFFQRVLLSIVERDGRFQILCANCNWIKRVTDGELPERPDVEEVERLEAQYQLPSNPQLGLFA